MEQGVIDSDDNDVQVSCPHVNVILPSGMNEQDAYAPQ